MYYRRKVLLALLEVFGGELERLNLQKLLMLFCREQGKPAFHFVPYHYGCFSFQANADLKTLSKYGKVETTDSGWRKASSENYLASLKEADVKRLQQLKSRFLSATAEELIYHTYTTVPYYAINSAIAEKHLSPAEQQMVDMQRPANNQRGLFTIGYEGISLEQYLNRLLQYDIKVLCDVRKNAFSMKYGFSKSQLKNACEGLGISYTHLPEVGIASNKRKKLECQADYDALFEDYRQHTLSTTDDQLHLILLLIEQHHRVALTCFEADICQCHRKPLAEAVASLPDFKYRLQHI